MQVTFGIFSLMDLFASPTLQLDGPIAENGPRSSFFPPPLPPLRPSSPQLTPCLNSRILNSLRSVRALLRAWLPELGHAREPG